MQPRKLTEKQVREVRAIWRRQPTIAELAKRYGLGAKAMGRLLKGETYKEIRT